MNRDEKSATIEEIAAQIEASEAIFAVDYKGISVPQAAELRAKLRESDASFRIVKNRLSKIAAEKAGEERLNDLLKGPTALTFVRGDTAQAAKTISSFSKANDVLTFKGGFMEGLSLDEDRFKAIAKLPGREVLIGQFAGVVASPLTGLVRGLGSLIQGLALQLGQIAEKGLVTGEAPQAEEKPADDAPAEESPEASQDEAEDADASAAATGPAAQEAGGETSEQDETSNDDASKEEE
jgi:large subunit ribosomal protein L10